MIINNYDDFLNVLYLNQDFKYKEFHGKLILDSNLIGVRTPILKKIAHFISKSDYNNFILNNKHKLYEEKLVHGLLIGYLKLDFYEIIKLLNDFTIYIDNWAICDLTASNLKIFSKNLDEGFTIIKDYLNNPNTWINRFGYVLLLDYYINDKYIDEILELCKQYKDEYYIKMSIAWLLSMCYLKYNDKTIKFLKQRYLDNWTNNKTIQKIIESKRVSNGEREILKAMKI